MLFQNMLGIKKETILFADVFLEGKLIYGEEQKLQSGREIFPTYLATPQKHKSG